MNKTKKSFKPEFITLLGIFICTVALFSGFYTITKGTYFSVFLSAVVLFIGSTLLWYGVWLKGEPGIY